MHPFTLAQILTAAIALVGLFLGGGTIGLIVQGFTNAQASDKSAKLAAAATAEAAKLAALATAEAAKLAAAVAVNTAQTAAQTADTHNRVDEALRMSELQAAEAVRARNERDQLRAETQALRAAHDAQYEEFGRQKDRLSNLERQAEERDMKHAGEIAELYKEMKIVKAAKNAGGEMLNFFQGFMRDILYSVTDGRLQLHWDSKTLPDKLRKTQPLLIIDNETGLVDARERVRAMCEARGFCEDRVQEAVSAVSEAATNAMVHGHGGEMTIYASTDTVQVWIIDHGQGISPINIPNAMLRKGFSTAGSMGQGFTLIAAFADKLDLMTTTRGTTIVLTFDRIRRDTRTEALLANIAEAQMAGAAAATSAPSTIPII